jgi:uncharacterized protein with gpF-like domain
VRDLLQSIDQAVRAASFKEADQLLSQATDLWPEAPGVQAKAEAIEETRSRFERLLRDAQKARRSGDLDAALNAAKAARSACPLSFDGQEQIRLINDAREQAQKLMRDGKALVLEAKFDQAKSRLLEARKLWKKNPEISRILSEVESIAGRYRAAMGAARKFLVKAIS